jgi:hypothetical protein
VDQRLSLLGELDRLPAAVLWRRATPTPDAQRGRDGTGQRDRDEGPAEEPHGAAISSACGDGSSNTPRL